MEVVFQDVCLNVQEHQEHEWLLDNNLVSEGYGVTAKAIRAHKTRNSSELIENKHWVLQNVAGSDKTFWTKKGVVRLGFFIKSERAKQFRDWAEDLILKKTQPQTQAEMILAQAQFMVDQERKTKEIETRLDKVEAKQKTNPEYFSVVGYASLKKVTVNMRHAAAIGRKCSALCRKRNLPIDKITDPRFGEINTYHQSVLEEVFNQEFFG